MGEESPFHEVIVGLDESEAALLVHLLVTFERLLRQGGLDDRQLRLLAPPGSDPPSSGSPIEVANAVAEMVELLERQR